MSEHASELMNYLRKLKVDYSLLLLLTAPKHVVSSHGCTAYLDNMYFQMALEPFCKMLIKAMDVHATPEDAKRMLKYCKDQSSQFLRSPTECLAGLRALFPSLPEEVLSEVEGDIRLNRPNFDKFFSSVSEDVQVYVPSVDPGKYLCSFSKNEVIERYASCKSKWGQHNPSFFQTYDMDVDENGKPSLATGSSVFVIFRNPSDAIRAVAGYLMDGKIGVPGKNGKITFRKVMGVNELFLPDALCNFILDCEMPVSFYGGRLSQGEIRASMDRFVSKLLSFWHSEGILPEGSVDVAIKEKSRPLPGGDFKVSIHAVPSIVATRSAHNAAQKRFLQAVDPGTGMTHERLIGQAKEAAMKNGGALPEGFALHDLEFWDFSAGKSNGIATQFSRKRQEDPYSAFEGMHVYMEGVRVDEERCAIPTPHDPAGLSKEQVMQILWQLCSSTPKYVTDLCYPAAYSEGFVRAVKKMDDEAKEGKRKRQGEENSKGKGEENSKGKGESNPEDQVGGGGPEAAPEGVAVGSSSLSNLQTWPISALQALSGRKGEVRTAPDGYQKIRSTLPPAIKDKVEIVCYNRGVCAHDIVSGNTANGTPKHHDGNGVFVAYTMEPPVVYLTCTTGGPGHRIRCTRGEDGAEYCKVINMRCSVMEDGTVEPVSEVAPDFVHWAMMGKEELDLLLKKIPGV